LLLLVLTAVTLISFILSNMIPTDPVLAYFGEQAATDPATLAKLRHELGLDQPLYLRYIVYLQNLFRGNLGWSIHTSRPVLQDLSQYFTATLELTLAAMAISLFLGVPLGIVSAIKKDRALDHFVRIFSLGGISAPIFWLAIMLQLLLCVRLGLFPLGGRVDTMIALTSPIKHITGLFILDSLLSANWAAFISCVHHLMLPATALSYRAIGLISRISRSSMLDVLGQDYVRTARAYGLPERIVVYVYSLKNSMISIVTVVGLTFGQLLQGSFLTEAIFSWPGMGLYAVKSIEFNDYMPILGVALVATVCYAGFNLIVDVLYTLVDPRIKY